MCEACHGLIGLVDPTPHIISLDMAWVHINRWGRVKRRVSHPPVVSE